MNNKKKGGGGLHRVVVLSGLGGLCQGPSVDADKRTHQSIADHLGGDFVV